MVELDQPVSWGFTLVVFLIATSAQFSWGSDRDTARILKAHSLHSCGFLPQNLTLIIVFLVSQLTHWELRPPFCVAWMVTASRLQRAVYQKLYSHGMRKVQLAPRNFPSDGVPYKNIWLFIISGKLQLAHFLQSVAISLIATLSHHDVRESTETTVILDF